VRTGDPGPSPSEKGAAHNESNEQQMDDHYKVSANPVPHLVTCSTDKNTQPTCRCRNFIRIEPRRGPETEVG
jgi:hypothetical protein